MDASILLVGSQTFLTLITDRVHQLVACTVNSALSSAEAMPLIQAQQPDLVLVQADLEDALDLCQQVKAQTRLAWIYCLVLDLPDLEFSTLEAFGLEASGQDSTAIQAPATNYDPASQRRRREAHWLALTQGADAYLNFAQADWVGGPLLPPAEGPLADSPAHSPGSEADRLDSLHLDWEGDRYETPVSVAERLLQAQILVGFRMVRNHRELMRTNDILSAIALADPLTELNNRRALDWEMPRQVQSARTRIEPLSVLMIDVDHFKSINDTHGHGAGDRVLQLIANRLRHNLRFRDTLFRYGGEEFVIILSATDQYEALAVGKRLCQLINANPFTVDTIAQPLDLPVTISVGAASLEGHDDPKGISLLKRADQNLLKAKAQGRNRAIGTIDDAELEAHLATLEATESAASGL
jgi:two-component system, cell cycle response regulator